MVQEALTNATKHAQAEKVIILLERNEAGDILLHIEDNGQGFDATVKPKGMGLLGMRERVEALNGKISLASTPGSGVSIEIYLPNNIQTEQSAESSE
jgi:signal transduction histidine kinase